MNLRELKDKVDELWNQADVEAKVDKDVFVIIEGDELYGYYPVEEIYIDYSKDVIIKAQ